MSVGPKRALGIGDPKFNSLFVNSKGEPSQITIPRGGYAYIDIALTYNYKPVFNAPEKVIVQMRQPKGNHIAILKAGLSLTRDELSKQLASVAFRSKEPNPSMFYDMGKLVSYPDSDNVGGENKRVELYPGATKMVKMRISIPQDFPDELVGSKGHMINPDFSIDSPLVQGVASGCWVSVTG